MLCLMTSFCYAMQDCKEESKKEEIKCELRKALAEVSARDQEVENAWRNVQPLGVIGLGIYEYLKEIKRQEKAPVLERIETLKGQLSQEEIDDILALNYSE